APATYHARRLLRNSRSACRDPLGPRARSSNGGGQMSIAKGVRHGLAMLLIGSAIVVVGPARSRAQAQSITCDPPKGVRFNGQVNETSASFTIVCRDLRSSNPTVNVPPWVTFVGTAPGRQGRFNAEFNVQANPNVFPRAGSIRITE